MQPQVGVCKSIHRIVILIVFGGLFVLTACATWDKSISIGSQPFIVDTIVGKQLEYGQVPPLLKLLTQDGKEKLEIFEGGNVELYRWQMGKWEWSQGGHGGDSQVIGLSMSQFGVLEVTDPNIIKMEFETEKDKKQLSFIEVKSHRFIAFQIDPRHKDYYQIRGISKNCEIIWQLFPDGYWKQ
jgi:hypothetical protein